MASSSGGRRSMWSDFGGVKKEDPADNDIPKVDGRVKTGFREKKI